MVHGHAEGVFEAFLAGENLLARLGQGHFGQIHVRHCVRADGVPGSQPFADLGDVHQRHSGISVGGVPLVFLP